jgi:heptosyltransferase-2
MNCLIVKLNATGDVVRTTPLLRRLKGAITWVTAAGSQILLEGVMPSLRCIPWERRQEALDTSYDLVINLEDEREVASFVQDVCTAQLFGAYLDKARNVAYTGDARGWFDMSLISRSGRKGADELKLANRRSYQDLIFAGLGFKFSGEEYVLPTPVATDLIGDVAIAPVAGPVWPMKNWAYYGQLRKRLEDAGLKVNVLPRRKSLLEHLGDVGSHRCVVAGDSLPMHLALGLGIRCVAIFNCTSPWEIHDYGRLAKIVSPLLAEYFYKRDIDPRATSAIGVEEVIAAVLEQLSVGGLDKSRFRCRVVSGTL